jgi:hypothetical protein
MFKRIKVLSNGYSSRRRNNKVLLENDSKSALPLQNLEQTMVSQSGNEIGEIAQQPILGENASSSS